MDEEQNKEATELEATKPAKEEEVRAKIIAEYGFDEVDDAERIDKLTKKELEHGEKLSQAIGQKIKYRSKVEELEKNPSKPKTGEPTATTVDVDKVLDAKLQERDLSEMEFPDKIKNEIKRIAAITGQSVKQAARDPYIVSTFIKPWQEEQKADEAAITRTNRSGGKKAFSVDNPPDPDMTTEEGRKEWDNYKEFLKEQGL